MTDLKEETESTEETPVCEHERCVVLTLGVKVQFRENGETMSSDIKQLGPQIHGQHSIKSFLDLLGTMQEAVYTEAEWVMNHFGLPPEIVALAVKGDIAIEVHDIKERNGE